MQPVSTAAFALLLACALGGCAMSTPGNPGPTVMPELRATETTPHNETRTASAGSVIYIEHMGSRRGAKLLQGVSGAYLPDDKITFVETSFDAPAGTELIAMAGSPSPMYCSLEPVFQFSKPGCFFDTDDNGAFDRVMANGNGHDYFTQIGAMGMAIDPVPYEKKEPAGSALNGRAELIYKGRDGDRIRFRYHGVLISRKASLLTGNESGDFYDSFSFDMPESGSQEIVANGARIEVLSATDEEITYRVLSPFRGFRFSRMVYRQY